MEKIKKMAVPKVGEDGCGAAINELRVSVGNMTGKAYPEPKTSGIKVRGTGAATKGVMARGPMA